MSKRKKASKKRVKTTKKHFKYFKKCYRKYAKRYGLKEWRFDFVVADLEGVHSLVQFYEEDRVLTIALNANFPSYSPPTEKLLRSTAKHEVHESVVGELYCLAIDRYASQTQIERAKHSLVRRLDRVIE